MISDFGISISDFFNLKSKRLNPKSNIPNPKFCAVVGVVTNNFFVS